MRKKYAVLTVFKILSAFGFAWLTHKLNWLAEAIRGARLTPYQ